MPHRFATALTAVLGTLAFASCPLDAATRARLSHVTDLGRAPGTERVSFAATLAYRDDAQLERLVALQSDPDSPLYGHYLTNDQFDARLCAVAGRLRTRDRAVRTGRLHDYENVS